mmetsp:Transcript_17082/g.22561  ORF Transcript_17082/g.22561 Transcript_17082/m.22561 type:complete len:627 (+) Transcript_17082:77-1957(+)
MASENSKLLVFQSATDKQENVTPKKSDYQPVLFGIALLFFLGSLLVIPFSNINSLQRLTDLSESSSTVPRSSISNKYTLRDGPAGLQYEWVQGKLLAEPFMPSTLGVTDQNDEWEYEWEIYDLESGKLERTLYGAPQDVSFMELKDKLLIMREFSRATDGKQVLQYEESNEVLVKYVRREIRALTEDDREDFLDAMYIHWSVDQTTGEELYGSKYQSALTLLKYHLRYAGDYDCDHFHDGYGFLSQHSALTLLFEQSLQAVNPRIALPYWDYVIDVEKTYDDNGGDFSDFNNGELFTADYFGSTDKETFYIKDGRWANLVVPKYEDLSPEDQYHMPHNAFGYMRAPWSKNSDEHLIRASTECGSNPAYANAMPTCLELDNLMKMDFLSFMKTVSYAPHGPVHIALGGTLGCIEAFESLLEYGFSDSQITKLKNWGFVFHRNAYRGGFLDCSDINEEGCSCPDLTRYKNRQIDRTYFLAISGMMDIDSYTSDQQAALVDTICNSGLVDGDNLQASSSYSPEFWPIHGTVERMFQLKRLNNDFDPDDIGWDIGSWSAMQEDCFGHFMDDLVLLGSAPLTIQNEEIQPTNLEFLEMLSPTSSDLPYIYDNLDWDVCELQGYTFMKSKPN